MDEPRAGSSIRLASVLALACVSCAADMPAGDGTRGHPDDLGVRGLMALYHESSLVPSRLEEHARFSRALSEELAAHVRAIDGVVSASVIVSPPICDPLAAIAAEPRPATASVVATVDSPGDGDRARDIARLVAAGVHGLAADDVAVAIAHPRARPSPAPRLAALGPFDVGRGSRRALLAIAAALLAVIVALALWALSAERRGASLRARLAAAER